MNLDIWQWLEAIKGAVHCEQPLASMVAYGIGGPAQVLVRPADENDVAVTLSACKKFNVSLTVIGSGTNLLIGDQGLRGVVLDMGVDCSLQPQIIKQSKTQTTIRVSSKMAKAKLLDWSVINNFSGLEFSAGIPGTMGGAVFMNAGTKWGSYGDVIEKVKLFNCEKGFFEKTREQMKFKYRGHGEGLLDQKTVVISVDLKLQKHQSNEKIINQIDQILIYRGQRQPLEFNNCGSVFKNPANGRGAGRLIEAAGLKGLRVGDAMVSKQHANFISNLGHATAQDVGQLIELIQKSVLDQFGVSLEREVIFLEN